MCCYQECFWSCDILGAIQANLTVFSFCSTMEGTQGLARGGQCSTTEPRLHASLFRACVLHPITDREVPVRLLKALPISNIQASYDVGFHKATEYCQVL